MWNQQSWIDERQVWIYCWIYTSSHSPFTVLDLNFNNNNLRLTLIIRSAHTETQDICWAHKTVHEFITRRKHTKYLLPNTISLTSKFQNHLCVCNRDSRFYTERCRIWIFPLVLTLFHCESSLFTLDSQILLEIEVLLFLICFSSVFSFYFTSLVCR